MRQAAVALIEKDGLFLSVSRKNDATKRGFPGGKRDNFEELNETMVRELFEETGVLALEYYEFFKQEKDDDFETTAFIVTKYENEPFSKESGVVEWVSREDLESGPFGKFNKNLFEKYSNK